MPCCGLLRIAVFAAAFGSMMLLLTAYLVPGIVPAGTVVYVAPGFLDSYLLLYVFSKCVISGGTRYYVVLNDVPRASRARS